MTDEYALGYVDPTPAPTTLVPSTGLLKFDALPPIIRDGESVQDKIIKECARKWAELLQRLPPPPPNQEWWPVMTDRTETETGGIYVVITPELRWLPGTAMNPCAPED